MLGDLARLLPKTVHLVELSDPALSEPLYPEEEAAIARAVEKRKLEFALGRTAARRALSSLGITARALPTEPDRSVRWPSEAWGSITHADGFCAAAAALRRDHGGVGIDVEVRRRVHRELWRHVATAREIAWFDRAADEDEARERATLLFSAKEAFYKAQYCVSRAWVGFMDVEVEFQDEGRFEVTLQRAVEHSFVTGQRFHGRFMKLPFHVLTGLALPP